MASALIEQINTVSKRTRTIKDEKSRADLLSAQAVSIREQIMNVTLTSSDCDQLVEAIDQSDFSDESKTELGKAVLQQLGKAAKKVAKKEQPDGGGSRPIPDDDGCGDADQCRHDPSIESSKTGDCVGPHRLYESDRAHVRQGFDSAEEALPHEQLARPKILLRQCARLEGQPQESKDMGIANGSHHDVQHPGCTPSGALRPSLQ